MTNQAEKIVLASITLIVAAGLLALNPSSLSNAQAVPYGADYDSAYPHGLQYGDHYDTSGYDDNNRYGYDNYDNTYYPEPKKDKKIVNLQEIKCINKNLNLNGLDITQIPQDPTTWSAANEAGEGTNAANTQNGDGLSGINVDRNLVNICVNLNFNNQERVPVLGDITNPFP
ncbi:MAG TPA: hypothetical protein VJ767_06620 [Nitrososphaeraceae archaeon]|nr:hypothetical protein [Nitrososphaeraceae archaeon]